MKRPAGTGGSLVVVRGLFQEATKNGKQGKGRSMADKLLNNKAFLKAREMAGKSQDQR
jgi:hypothetical protein